MKNNGLSIFVLILLLGVFTLPGSVWLNGLFDPLAARIPNLFSDFTGHVNLGAYLHQRGFVLFFGLGLAVLAVIPYPRIHNNVRARYRLTWVALLPLLLAGSLAGVYSHDLQSVPGKREAYREVYSKHVSSRVLKISENRLHVKEAEDGGNLREERDEGRKPGKRNTSLGVVPEPRVSGFLGNGKRGGGYFPARGTSASRGWGGQSREGERGGGELRGED